MRRCLPSLPWLLLAALAGRPARAQTAPAALPRNAFVFDLTRALGSSLNYTSAAGWALFGLDEAARLQAGVGLRGSYFFAATGEYDGQNVPAGQTLQVPNPPQALKDAITNEQTVVAQANAASAQATAQVAQARAETAVAVERAKQQAAQIAGYPSVAAYLQALAIQSKLNPFQPTYLVPGTEPK